MDGYPSYMRATASRQVHGPGKTPMEKVKITKRIRQDYLQPEKNQENAMGTMRIG